MGDEDVIDVKVKATDGTGPGLGEASDNVDEFAEHTTDQFTRIAEKLAEYFAIEKVIEFTKKLVENASEIEDAMTRLGETVKAGGGDWDAISESVSKYATNLSETTKFTKSELLNSLADVNFRVNDISKAMGIENMAVKLATVTHKDLKTSADELTLAFEGNSRGVIQLARDLGVGSDKAKDTAFLFSEVERRSKDAGDEQKNFGFQIHELETAVSELSEKFLDVFGPTLIKILQTTKDFVDATKDALGWWEKLFGVIDEHSSKDELSKALAKQKEGMAGINKELEAETQFYRLATGSAKEHALEVISELQQELAVRKKAADEIEAQMNRTNKEVTAATDSQVISEAIANGKRVANAKLTEKEIEKAHEEALKRQEKATEEAWKNAAKNMDDAFKKYQKEIEVTTKMFEKYGKETEKAAKDGTKAFVDASKKGQDASKALANSLVKDGADAVAQLLTQWADYWFAQAAANFASENYLSGALDVAAGGLLDVAAGVIQGSVTALASGGIVTSPTYALVGEAGPEAVIPLSKGSGYGLGGDTTINGGMHLHLPGVTSPSDFKNGSVQQSISRQLSSQLQSVQSRKGLRTSSGIA